MGKSRLGFTLIELLVVISIMGVFVGGGIASYRRFNQQQVLLEAGKRMMTTLRQAQSNASSGVKPQSPSSTCTMLQGYSVSSLGGSPPTSFQIAQICLNGATTVNYTTSTLALPAGLAFQNAFSFSFLGQLRGVTTPTTISIVQTPVTSSSLRYNISVDASGAINDLGIIRP